MTDPKAARNALVVLLRAKRNGMTPAAKAKRKKPIRWLYPWATEHHYATLYKAWVKPVSEFVHEYIQNHHESVLRGDDADVVIRQDAVAGESFSLMVQSLTGWVRAYVSDDEQKKLRSPIYMGLGNVAESAFSFNGTQYEKSAESVLGINFPSDESWWASARKMWQDTNYQIIKSDIQKYISDINTATEQAVTNGWNIKVLTKKIMDLDSKITKSRANFIARDQIGKLNGTITQKRMQDIGLTMYEWSSSSDERVRESHALMDGKLCRWDDATVYSADGGKSWQQRPSGAVLMHPGMDYQCRCTALAWFNELIDEADGVETPVSASEPVNNNSAPKDEPKKTEPVLSGEFIPATSINGANEYAKNVLGIAHADYKGVALEAANEWNRGLTENFKKFPELKERFGFVGECHARNSAAKKKFFEINRKTVFELFRKYNPELSDEVLAPYVEKQLGNDWKIYAKAHNLSVSKYTTAESWSPTGWAKEFAGITVNKDRAISLASFEAVKAASVEHKFHPVGCGTLKATLDHEIGHQVDSLLDLRNDSVILDFWKDVSKDKQKLTEELSEYAWNNDNPQPIGEFIAEAWAEYCNNPEPRMIAKTVGKRAEEVYKSWKKKQ